MFDAKKKISGMKSARLFGLFIFLTAVYLISVINVQAQYYPLPYLFPSYPYFNPLISPLISPFPVANFPIFAPTVFPASTSLPPSSVPTAAIQGTTVYIPVAATSLNVSIGAPGLGLGPGTNLFGVTPPLAVFIYPSGYVPSVPVSLASTVISSTVYVPPSAISLNIGIGAPGLGLGPLPKLTGVAPPTTVLIYPVGFVPPALAPVPVPVVPSPVVPVPVAPSPTTPVTVAPSPVTPVVVTPTVVTPTTIPPTTTALSAAVSGLGFLWFNPFFPIF